MKRLMILIVLCSASLFASDSFAGCRGNACGRGLFRGAFILRPAVRQQIRMEAKENVRIRRFRPFKPFRVFRGRRGC